MKKLLLLSLLINAGCQTSKVTDPKTGVLFEQMTFLTNQGPKEVQVIDGDRSIILRTGPKDQTKVAEALISLATTLK